MLIRDEEKGGGGGWRWRGAGESMAQKMLRNVLHSDKSKLVISM